MNENLDELESILGYTFKNKKLLLEALTHKSCKESFNNERLEFLGDAVLDLVVGEYLFVHLPDASEGEMSKLRASLVNEGSFAMMAQKRQLSHFIRLSSAEEKNHGRTKPSLISDVFEAIFGAIYLDSNLADVTILILDLLKESYPNITLDSLFRDHKTVLQEITQADYKVTPVYTLISSSGPDHNKEFKIRLTILDKEYAIGVGKSKKLAQQDAAEIALTKIKQERV
jgi:ribonuclease III